MPGGAFCSEDQQWHPTSSGFVLPVHALSTLCWAKFRELMAKGGWLEQIPAEVWTTPWNVNCQAVGSSATSVKYLAPYVFKVAIADNRIVKVDNDQVTFRYRHPHSQHAHHLSISHKLPKGR